MPRCMVTSTSSPLVMATYAQLRWRAWLVLTEIALLLGAGPSCRQVKAKVKVWVYSLVSSAKRHSPDVTQLPPGHRTCSFISHLNSPGSIQPGLPFFGARNYSNTQAFTVLPVTHSLLGQASARVSKVPCLRAQRRNIFSAAGDRTRDLSLVRRARYH